MTIDPFPHKFNLADGQNTHTEYLCGGLKITYWQKSPHGGFVSSGFDEDWDEARVEHSGLAYFTFTDTISVRRFKEVIKYAVEAGRSDKANEIIKVLGLTPPLRN